MQLEGSQEGSSGLCVAACQSLRWWIWWSTINGPWVSFIMMVSTGSRWQMTRFAWGKHSRSLGYKVTETIDRDPFQLRYTHCCAKKTVLVAREPGGKSDHQPNILSVDSGFISSQARAGCFNLRLKGNHGQFDANSVVGFQIRLSPSPNLFRSKSDN